MVGQENINKKLILANINLILDFIFQVRSCANELGTRTKKDKIRKANCCNK